MTKVLIVEDDNSQSLLRQSMKEKFGDDVILVTSEEAKEQGLIPDNFPSISQMKIPVLEVAKIHGYEMTGQEKRRERRRKERKKGKP